MVKSLSDLCLTLVANRIHEFKDLGDKLTREQCEILIERMCSHGQFDPSRLPWISRFLISSVLRAVSLVNCMQLDDSVLGLFAKAGCNLKYLRIEKCKLVTDFGVGPLLKQQKELEQLSLRSLPTLTGQCFESIHGSKLKIVDLKYCDSLLSASLSHLTTNCTSIKSLNVSMCSKVDDLGIISVAKNLNRNLEVLKVNSMSKLREDGVIALADHCPNLKVINLYGCSGISSYAVAKLFRNCPIGVVDVSYCYKVPQGLDVISPSLASTLTKMVHRGVQLSRETLVSLCRECIHLQCLEVCGVHCITDETLEEIVEVRGDKLQEFDLSWCRPVTDRGLRAIVTGCKKLLVLSIGFCENLNGKPLKLLGKPRYMEHARSLRKLEIGACRQVNASIFDDFLSVCTNLEVLNTAGLKEMSNDHLRLLSCHCPRLKILNLKGCQEITDSGICELVSSCPIEGLVLSGIHNLTDKTIFALASTVTSTLQHLYLSGCAQISPHTVRYLKDVCIKGIFVEHRTPNAAPQQLMAKNLDTGEFCRADLMY